MQENILQQGWAAKRRLVVGITAVGVLVYCGIALGVDAPRVIAALGHLGWQGVAAVLALSCANYLLRFVRWHLYILQFGHRIAAPRHLLIYLAGFAFTLSPGKAGEAIRSWYLREHGVSYAQSLAAFFVERMLDVLAIAFLAALFVADHRGYRGFVGGALGVIALVILAVTRPGLPGRLDASATQRGGRLGSLAAALAKLLRSSSQLLRLRPLSWGIVSGACAWACLGMGFYLVCRGLNLSITPPAAVGIYAIAILAANAAIFLPGGLGGTEVVMVALLHEGGASLPGAVIAALLCSLASLWLAVLVGIAAAALLELPHNREALDGNPSNEGALD